MYILTSLLAAAWAGFQKGVASARKQPPRVFTGPIQTAHFLPGRIRFRIPSLRGNPSAKSLLMTKLPLIKGVHHVEVNIISGSVLIYYDEDKVYPTLLFASLIRLLRLEDELNELPQNFLKRELREIGKSLNMAVYDRTGGLMDLWTGLAFILGVYGFMQLLAEGSYALPEGGILLGWAMRDLGISE